MRPARLDARKIKEILERYNCPLEYHEVRTRIIGAIATPEANVMPMRVINGLWDNKMPEFKSIGAVNELMGIMIEELWNSLKHHQKRTDPFHLINIKIDQSRAGAASYARIRIEEIDGFVTGLVNGLNKIEFPKRVTQSLERLEKIRKILADIEIFSQDPSKCATQYEFEAIIKKIISFKSMIEKEINGIIIQCSFLRRLTMYGPNGVKPVYQ